MKANLNLKTAEQMIYSMDMPKINALQYKLLFNNCVNLCIVSLLRMKHKTFCTVDLQLRFWNLIQKNVIRHATFPAATVLYWKEL